jgi:hypothetical protein
VPKGLVRILDRDLKLAGIPKRDERGRTVDVHAMRHTFGTLLSKGGVAPRTAQTAMRHSSLDLTMNVYTDPKLLDVAGAMEALPALPLNADPTSESAAMKATGTDDSSASQFAPGFAPTPYKSGTPGSIPVKMATLDDASKKAENPQFSPENQGFSDSSASGRWRTRTAPLLLVRQGAPCRNLLTGQGVTATPPAVCTRVCTGEAENAHAGPLDGDQGDDAPGAPDPLDPAGPAGDDPHQASEATGPADDGEESSATGGPAAGEPADQGDPVAKLAAALLNLPPADRERLAAMLAGQDESEGAGA